MKSAIDPQATPRPAAPKPPLESTRAFGAIAEPAPSGAARRCRSCDDTAVEPVVSLGLTPLANELISSPDAAEGQARYPLDLVFCPRCALVQITETVDPEVLFQDYLYFSSFSDTMLKHAERLARRLVEERQLGPDSLVIELASNDGYLLDNYVKAEVPVLGIEPARNVAEVAEAAGIPTLVAFFDAALGARLATEGRRADVVHAHNVLAHVADTNGFVQGIAHVLEPTGVAVVEVPYLRDFLDGCEFDTIYHEHLCYFSLSALDALFSRNGLTIRHVERLSIHGGSLRIFADRRRSSARSDAFHALMAEEASWGVRDPATYRGFGDRVREVRDDLRALLGELKGAGKSIAAYGAAAKGSTLLNYIGVGRETIDFVVDRSPHKQGRFMPGVGIPIHAPEKLAEAQPDYTLLLTWNFAEEIVRQQASYRCRGGRFILPVPHPKIIEGELLDGVQS